MGLEPLLDCCTTACRNLTLQYDTVTKVCIFIDSSSFMDSHTSMLQSCIAPWTHQKKQTEVTEIIIVLSVIVLNYIKYNISNVNDRTRFVSEWKADICTTSYWPNPRAPPSLPCCWHCFLLPCWFLSNTFVPNGQSYMSLIDSEWKTCWKGQMLLKEEPKWGITSRKKGF